VSIVDADPRLLGLKDKLRRVMHNSSNQQVGQAVQRTTELDVESLPAG
jgi:hypothetical protein